MSYASLMVHPLAIVTPVPAGDPTDPDDLDEYGHPEAGDPAVALVRGMVQPRTAREQALTTDAGVELTDYTIFLLPRQLSATAYITDADGSGPLAGGRRFEIVGVRSYEFGTRPHLELDARLVGSVEGPTVPEGS